MRIAPCGFVVFPLICLKEMRGGVIRITIVRYVHVVSICLIYLSTYITYVV